MAKVKNTDVDCFEYFEKYKIYPIDFKINTYKYPLFDMEYKNGIQMGIEQLDIMVCCHSEVSQIRNRNKCFKMLKLIIDDLLKEK